MISHPKKNISQLGLESGDYVADLGAGPGKYALACAEAVGETGQVTAVEIQKTLVKKVETKAREAGYTNVDVLWADLERKHSTSLKDESQDVVICANVLFQMKDKTALFQEAKRILKPSGRLLLVDWEDSHGGLGPRADHVVPESQARSVASNFGFSVSQIISAGDHHYGIIFST